MTGMVHIFMVAEMIGGKVGDRINNMHAYYFFAVYKEIYYNIHREPPAESSGRLRKSYRGGIL